MNELQIFKNEQFGAIRTVEQSGEPWFVGKDVAFALGYANARDAIGKHVDDDDKGVAKCDTLGGGEQNMTIINESGLYSLVLSSKLESAKAFKRWITHEVIPTIRKHGAYATPDTLERMLADPDSMIKVLTALKEEREQRIALESKVEEQKPQVLFAEAVKASKTSILVGEMAKILKQNGIDIGQQRLFQWLRENGYLMRRGSDYNMPTQYSLERGIMEIKETVVNNPDGSTRVTKTPKITGKGQVYFVNKFLRRTA